MQAVLRRPPPFQSTRHHAKVERSSVFSKCLVHMTRGRARKESDRVSSDGHAFVPNPRAREKVRGRGCEAEGERGREGGKERAGVGVGRHWPVWWGSGVRDTASCVLI